VARSANRFIFLINPAAQAQYLRRFFYSRQIRAGRLRSYGALVPPRLPAKSEKMIIPVPVPYAPEVLEWEHPGFEWKRPNDLRLLIFLALR
jgi:hypothetical protein